MTATLLRPGILHNLFIVYNFGIIRSSDASGVRAGFRSRDDGRATWSCRRPQGGAGQIPNCFRLR